MLAVIKLNLVSALTTVARLVAQPAESGERCVHASVWVHQTGFFDGR